MTFQVFKIVNYFFWCKGKHSHPDKVYKNTQWCIKCKNWVYNFSQFVHLFLVFSLLIRNFAAEKG